MKRETHRQALNAAARIACAAALVGCAKNQTPEVAPEAAPAEPTSAEPASAEPASTEPDAFDPFNPLGLVSLSDAELAACEQRVEDAFKVDLTTPAEDAPQSEWDAYYTAHREKLEIAKGDAEVKSCCQALAMPFDSFQAATTWEHHESCCKTLDWQAGILACTPWGPPTPPAMIEEA